MRNLYNREKIYIYIYIYDRIHGGAGLRECGAAEPTHVEEESVTQHSVSSFIHILFPKSALNIKHGSSGSGLLYDLAMSFLSSLVVVGCLALYVKRFRKS